MNKQNDPEKVNIESFEEKRQERIWLREVIYIPLGQRALAAKHYRAATLHLREAVKLDPIATPLHTTYSGYLSFGKAARERCTLFSMRTREDGST